MEKTFSFNKKTAKSILDGYKDFLKTYSNQIDKSEDKILKLMSELTPNKLSIVLEQAIYSSLEKEEGINHNFSLILIPPNIKTYHLDLIDICFFECPISISLLSKLAPAFESTNKKLFVWFDNNEARIWGFGSGFGTFEGIEIKSFSPGRILVHVKPLDFPDKRYLLSFSESKLVKSNVSLTKLLFNEIDAAKLQSPSEREVFIRFSHRRQKRYWFLIDVINKIMNHKHGGTLLFVPQENSEKILTESIRSVSYQPKVKYKYIEDKFIREEKEVVYADRNNQTNSSLPWSFLKDADFIAQITAVDGATILNKDFGVLAFGAKIKAKDSFPNKDTDNKLEKVWISEPFENFEEYEEKLAELGGMRHQSAAQFVFDQRKRDVFAIVASEDGKVSIMYWDKFKQAVTVSRHIEYLFYGMNI